MIAISNKKNDVFKKNCQLSLKKLSNSLPYAIHSKGGLKITLISLPIFFIPSANTDYFPWCPE